MTEVEPPPNGDFIDDGASFFGSGVSMMGDGASSMSSSMFSAMPDVPDVGSMSMPSVPDVGLPDVGLPEVGMPDMGISSMPNMNPLDVDVGGSLSDSASSFGSFMPSVPDVAMPSMSMPDVPEMGMPEMGMPDLGMPDIPDMGMSEMIPDMNGAAEAPPAAEDEDEAAAATTKTPVEADAATGATTPVKQPAEAGAEPSAPSSAVSEGIRGSIAGMGAAMFNAAAAAEAAASEAAAAAASAAGTSGDDAGGPEDTSVLSLEEREKLKLKYRETTESLGSPDSLGKPAFKMLVKQLLAGDPMQPKAKDLDAAFAIADENNNGSIDEVEFVNMMILIKKGSVKGLGGGMFSSALTKKKSFRDEFNTERSKAIASDKL